MRAEREADPERVKDMSARSSAAAGSPSQGGARRKLIDRVARGLIASGGIIPLLSLLAILLVLFLEVLPLFRAPRAAPAAARALAAGAPPLHIAVDEFQEFAFVVTAGGGEYFSLRDGSPVAGAPRLDPSPATVTSVSAAEGNALVLGLSDGRIFPATVTADVTYAGGKRVVTPGFKLQASLAVDSAGRPARFVALAISDKQPTYAALFGPGDLSIVEPQIRKRLTGEDKLEMSIRNVSLPLEADVTAAALDRQAEDLILGTSSGRLVRVDLRDPLKLTVAPPVQGDGTAVTAMGFLLGGRTLVVGDAAGRVCTWHVQSSATDALVRVRRFETHGAAVVSCSPSTRDKGFVTLDAKGGVKLHYGTTGATTAELQAEGLVEATSVALAPRGNGIVAAGRGGSLARWDLSNPHPEVALQTLFRPVQYEGYPRPSLTWQTAGGTVGFEPKFSLTPLLFGTLKGTFYALVLAVPLGLLSALYVSQFMHPSIRGVVKPVIEGMAMLPTVVLGAIAGLWLAPRLERVQLGVELIPCVLAGVILAAVAGWRRLPRRVRGRFKPGTEALLLVPILLAGGALALALGGMIESVLPGGNYPAWLKLTYGLTFEQRNSVVVGFAMGFAVIPIIFTIAEDALSGVPSSLVAGSLALGATRWQTALNVVLPTASSGLLSAVMLGFGRAAGETMIVLMASGNTPTLSASPYTGFRALSVDSAISYCVTDGSTEMRVLFLSALLLFLVTLAVNTAAEIVRLRLRKKYACL